MPVRAVLGYIVDFFFTPTRHPGAHICAHVYAICIIVSHGTAMILLGRPTVGVQQNLLSSSNEELNNHPKHNFEKQILPATRPTFLCAIVLKPLDYTG